MPNEGVVRSGGASYQYVYALGEHPDTFCNELIKKPRVRASSRPPQAASDPVAKDPDVMDEDHPADTTIEDTGDVSMLEATQATQTTQVTQDTNEKDVGDAFELNQLLFLVGHVAIKQIVFLELIEREWKRQKDEKQTG